MPRYKLTRADIKNRKPGTTMQDGGGLMLVVGPNLAGSWILRTMVRGRRRDMGLGSLDWVDLDEARAEADRWRRVARLGGDPFAERDKERREADALRTDFATLTEDCFAARKASLKGDGDAGRWLSPLRTHVLPQIGDMPVSDIDQRVLRDLIAPIWHDKPVAAKKALTRIGLILDHALALGIEVDALAVKKARALLGEQRHQTTGIAAMPYEDVPKFFVNLTEESPATYALQLVILTAMRSGPVRHLELSEIDGDVWTIPAQKMKGRVKASQDFRVPLSPAALDVIKQASRFRRGGFLFPGRSKGVISDMSMTRIMDRRKITARPHGFRTSFRTWAGQQGVERDIAERCLAHVIGGQVERAYDRADYLDQRREVLDAWARFVMSEAAFSA